MGDIYKIREFGYMQKSLDGLMERQNAVASNITNVSTPGYKAKRVEFEKQLSVSMGQGIGMTQTDKNHLPNGSKGVYGMKPHYKVTLTGAREDGNTVDLDKEMAINGENNIRYQMITQIFSEHLQEVLSAIKGEK
ncbi:Flagellar basal-body rod protein FlgB [hydrothermal vent metagenome]|uniref:Flagellar basal-body rod protein FlgB n=1 Tax=hydrothermal vent metagenome TaxID=652676 RepID=A0A3B1CDD2_9ZZZZ